MKHATAELEGVPVLRCPICASEAVILHDAPQTSVHRAVSCVACGSVCPGEFVNA